MNICSDMEQIVLLPAFVYNNNSLNTQSATKQGLPKCQAEKNLTYQFDSLKKGMNKRLFVKADSLVDKKIISFPGIKLSLPQTFILDGDEM